MNTMEMILAAMTVFLCVLALWGLVRVDGWRARLLVIILGGMIGVAGIATVFGYHELCCVNYRLSGEYKREGNNLRDWLTFIVPLIIQIGAVIGVLVITSRQVNKAKADLDGD